MTPAARDRAVPPMVRPTETEKLRTEVERLKTQLETAKAGIDKMSSELFDSMMDQGLLKAQLAERDIIIRAAITRARKRICRTCKLPDDACDVYGEPTRHATCERWAREARRLERDLNATKDSNSHG